MRSKVIAGKFKLGLEQMQRNMSNNNSHVSIALTLNFSKKNLGVLQALLNVKESVCSNPTSR